MRKIKPIVIVALLAMASAVAANLVKNETTHGGTGNPVKPEVPVEAFTVSPETIADTVDVVGTLSPKARTDVKAEYPGVVRDIHVREWVRVRKGDRLLSLDTREPMAMLSKAAAACDMEKANLLQAQVSVTRAEREYGRVVRLNESGLTASQVVDEAGTARDAAFAQKTSVSARLAAAEQELAQAKLRFSKTVITSPIDGTVAERRINEGDLAKDTPLFTIVDNRVLDLTVTVPSRFMASLKPGIPLEFSTDAFPGRTFTGRVRYVNPVVNDGDRSIKVIAEVPNPSEELKGGLFVKGRIVTGVRQNVSAIPGKALLNWDMDRKKAEILVAENGTARRRKVDVGSVHGDRVEIPAGLAKGDQVILRGGFNVADGDHIRVNGGK